LQNVIDALAPLPVRVLVTLGGSIAREDLTAAINCEIVESAPHTIVMRQAALVITHGGHGTVMRALVSRIPTLVIPHGRDQNDNAVRVTARSAGLALPPTASTAEIRAALARLLDDPTFARAAAGLGEAVARDVARSPVVKILERLAEAPAQQRCA